MHKSPLFSLITLFPKFFESPFSTGILGSAIEDKKIQLSYIHLVDFKESPSRRVDDTPFGGGAGMVLRPEPVARAIEHAKAENSKRDIEKMKTLIVHFTPRGERFTQAKAEQLIKKYDHFILLCGRYEGIDQRVLDTYVDKEYCVGDSIVSGGEYPALIFVDTLARLTPGVLGNDESHSEESFSKTLGRKKEYPHYTRPEEWRGQKVPDVLLSGHHKHINSWRKKMVK